MHGLGIGCELWSFSHLLSQPGASLVFRSQAIISQALPPGCSGAVLGLGLIKLD